MSIHVDVELLALLTRQIASGRPLEALSLIDRLLAAGPARRDSSAAADLRVLRKVVELELARQLGSRQRAGSDPDGGAIATVLEFADRILPALQRNGRPNGQTLLPEPARGAWSWSDPDDRSSASSPARVLSDRAFELLDLVAIGQSNQKIARALSISEGTVKKHLSNVLAKLDAENRTEAVALARRRGMLE
jgi:DNA-binding CsgD family transcriptional regulator